VEEKEQEKTRDVRVEKIQRNKIKKQLYNHKQYFQIILKLPNQIIANIHIPRLVMDV
jgi:hypothetical protein